MKEPGITAGVVATLAADRAFNTLQCAADLVGVSKERVRQIIEKNDLEYGLTLRSYKWPCPDCGKMFRRPRHLVSKLKTYPAHCPDCGTRRRYENARRDVTCPKCKRTRTLIESEYQHRKSDYCGDCRGESVKQSHAKSEKAQAYFSRGKQVPPATLVCPDCGNQRKIPRCTRSEYKSERCRPCASRHTMLQYHAQKRNT